MKKYSLRLNLREWFIIVAAIKYALANYDELNEAYADDEMPEIIKLEGGDLFGLEIDEDEIGLLAFKLINTCMLLINNDKQKGNQ